MRSVRLVIKTALQAHSHPLPSPHLLLQPLHTPKTARHYQLQNPPHTTQPVAMPTYIVTCKEDATPEQFQAAKKHAEDQGGKIGHEYSLIKGFSVEFPEDQISTLEKHEHVKHVEKDQEVRTQ
ncbi:peptidase inhibitor i9 [Colletotrichum kahawae]|uniref:Peptidase inhibitor i9 n=1 Tax=Colletotrichum kahawae TaxID=34407 RepID=A0AAD9YST1_COLKA|nr:peptidase inhibitor i9 [Colletotrichum kahawae]